MKKIEFDYEIPEDWKFEYAGKGGNLETAQMIRFFAPNSKVMTHCADLKQMFFRALPQEKAEDSESVDTNVDIDGTQVIMLITQSHEVDLSKFLLTAKELFSNDFIAKIDGEQRFTKPLLELVDNDCMEEMVGEYMANFILASAFKKIKELLSQK